MPPTIPPSSESALGILHERVREIKDEMREQQRFREKIVGEINCWQQACEHRITHLESALGTAKWMIGLVGGATAGLIIQTLVQFFNSGGSQ